MFEDRPHQESITPQEAIEALSDLLSDGDKEFLAEGITGEEADIQFVMGYVMFALQEQGQDPEKVLRERGILQDEN